MEKVNHLLKHIVLREIQQNPGMTISVAVERATKIYNRTPKLSGYSPFFLLYGTTPPDEDRELVAYTREPSDEEELAWERCVLLRWIPWFSAFEVSDGTVGSLWLIKLAFQAITSIP